MVNNLPTAEAVRLAVAAGTATVAMRGSNVAGRDSIDQVLPRVLIEEQDQGIAIGRSE
jgi:fructose-1-phosphate kinase PfkB-like protein